MKGYKDINDDQKDENEQRMMILRRRDRKGNTLPKGDQGIPSLWA